MRLSDKIFALDGMGSDNCPFPEVEAAVQVYKDKGIKPIIVGSEPKLRDACKKLGLSESDLMIHHTDDVVTMEDHPSAAIRKKKESSMMVAIRMVHEGKAGAVVSAGNSGAFMAGAIFILGRLNGVDRPAIAGMMPTMKGPTVVLDMGANVDCKPEHLIQFAAMGSVYARNMLGKPSPTIGVLNNGTEDSKGNELTRAVHSILKKSSLNYTGYIEGRDIFRGDVDVIVCDGFVGNIFLKTSEGLAETMGTLIKASVKKSPMALFGMLLALPTLKKVKKRWDYSEYGGAPLIGVKGLAIISHGRSSAKALKNAIIMANDYLEKGVNEKIVDELHKNWDMKNETGRVGY